MKTLHILLASFAIAACTHAITVEVSPEVINPGYLGNGIEWDPYDEALSWGNDVSDEDWDILYQRLDYMQPQYVRCMINSPFTYYNNGSYEHQRNARNIQKLLSYCQSRGIMVVYGEYNPPLWSLKDSPEWVHESVAHLASLVLDQGFDCIKYFVCFNEPDGNWASTNGDFAFWKGMAEMFQAEMALYPGLSEKVALAGPDAVIDYTNPASAYDYKGWLEHTVKELPDVGIYDMHAYPGQRYVRSGEFQHKLSELRSLVPEGKKIILGESGFKYFSDPADSLLAREYRKRSDACPYTLGSDCNMLVYDEFYALDMPLLLMSAMNAGFSGVAAWMADDAMHTNGDSGEPRDLKIWGMWNILGAEVFGDPSQEDIRPWYWTWSLMCKSFPAGSDILRVDSKLPDGLALVAARTPQHKMVVAMVNFGTEDRALRLSLPEPVSGPLVFYHEGLQEQGAISGKSLSLSIPAQTFALFTGN